MSRRQPDTEIHLGLQGVVKRIEVLDGRTGAVKRVVRSRPYENLLVDAGLDAVGDGSGDLDALTDYMAVGTGSTPPANGDTTLGAEVARTNSNGGFSPTYSAGPNTDYHEYEITRVFVEGEADGVALAEVGVFQNAVGGPMFMRQLLRDDLGDPTTVTLLATEQLRVVWAWRVWPQKTTDSQNLDISGTATTCDTRAVQIDQSDAWGTGVAGVLLKLGGWSGNTGKSFCCESNTLPGLTGAHGLSGEQPDNVSFASYTPGTFYRDATFTFGPSKGNFATGIGGVVFSPFGDFIGSEESFMTTFDPKVAKDDTLRFVYTCRISWARHV